MTKAKVIPAVVVEELKVDLSAVANPHPLLLKAYEEAGAMELFEGIESMRPEYQGEKRIIETSAGSNAPIKFHIGGIYRRSVGSSEFVFFHCHMSTLDFFQNPIDHTKFQGRWAKPVIVTRKSINPAAIRMGGTKKIEPTPQDPEIQGFETIYDYEFTAIKPQLLKWKQQGVINDLTHFYAWPLGPTKYSKPYNWEEWFNLDMSDLILLAKVGNRFDGIIKPGDPASVETLRAIIQDELKKGILNPQK